MSDSVTLVGEVSALEREIQEKEELLKELESKRQSFTGELTDIQTKINDLQRSLDKERDAYGEKLQEVKKVTDERSLLAGEVSKLQEQLSEKQAELQTARSEEAAALAAQQTV